MYKAYVTKIFTEPAPGFDNLVLGRCKGYQVLVGKDTENGQLGVFFGTDGQLSEEFATKNDLIRRKNPDGSKAGGMFEENRRIKAIKMKGVKSDGFWCPLSLFEYTGFDLSTLKEGDQFDELNGNAICNKYETPATIKAKNRAAKEGIPNVKILKNLATFPEHIDTNHFLREIQFIVPGALIMLSSKAHGTSHRITKTLCTQSSFYNKVEKAAYKLFAKFPKTKKAIPFLKRFKHFCFNYLSEKVWLKINGTRHTVMEFKEPGSLGFYGNDEFRYKITNTIEPHKNEIIYGEIVGYVDSGKPIMKPHDVTVFKSKEAEKRFGKTITYKYGCPDGTCEFLVYRICSVNEDGVITEYSWPQVVRRCTELKLRTVNVIESFIYDGNEDFLRKKVDTLVNGETGTELIPDPLDFSHIQEGIVVRYENPNGRINWLKHKSWAFGCMEGYQKMDDNFVDLEEIS